MSNIHLLLVPFNPLQSRLGIWMKITGVRQIFVDTGHVFEHLENGCV